MPRLAAGPHAGPGLPPRSRRVPRIDSLAGAPAVTTTNKRNRLLELTGKIINVLPEKSGTSARGPWRKQEYVIEIPGDYPKQVCFMVWGDKIDQFNVAEGQDLTVHFDLESREYNGRWYTDVKAWRIERSDAQGDMQDAPPPNEAPPPDEAPPLSDDDIPF